jgi:excisionase family DNA binding protein
LQSADRLPGMIAHEASMCQRTSSGPQGRRFLTVPEVAEELRISERSVWRLIEEGELPAHKFGSSTRVKREDLDSYIERCRRHRDDDEDDDGPPKNTP